jgi:hypothetical protein
MKTGHIVIAIMAFFALVSVMLGARQLTLYQSDQSPEQPVKFDHSTHVRKVGLDCTRCHQYADKGPRATLPPMSVCAECHAGMETKNPEILKLQDFLRQNKPVPWVKVHNLPDHVFFTHKAHIKAGVDCRMCHGDVGEMKRVRRARVFDMGFCVSCHAEKKAPMDCVACHK